MLIKGKKKKKKKGKTILKVIMKLSPCTNFDKFILIFTKCFNFQIQIFFKINPSKVDQTKKKKILKSQVYRWKPRFGSYGSIGHVIRKRFDEFFLPPLLDACGFNFDPHEISGFELSGLPRIAAPPSFSPGLLVTVPLRSPPPHHHHLR